jgi:hypothetical protein
MAGMSGPTRRRGRWMEENRPHDDGRAEGCQESHCRALLGGGRLHLDHTIVPFRFLVDPCPHGLGDAVWFFHRQTARNNQVQPRVDNVGPTYSARNSQTASTPSTDRAARSTRARNSGPGERPSRKPRLSRNNPKPRSPR